MDMFRRRSAGATADPETTTGSQAPDEEEDIRPAAETGKGRPTPKRSEANKGRYQSITGSRSSSRSSSSSGSSGSSSSSGSRTDRSRRYEAMKRGEDWALNARDKGPEKKLVRNYIDSKRRISEYYMYALIVLLVALFARNKTISDYISPLVIVLIVLVVIDGLMIRNGIRKLIAARLPGSSTRGLTIYGLMRALQIRRFRVPSPQVNPGDTF
jgi:cobalamin biosynthesis Mg chelatase CobN